MNGPTDGGRRRRPRDRFLCNGARRLSLLFFVVAVGALVTGAAFAEISTNGAPTPLETAVVRWVIVGSLVAGLVSYLVGSRMLDRERG